MREKTATFRARLYESFWSERLQVRVMRHRARLFSEREERREAEMGDSPESLPYAYFIAI